MAQLQLKKSAAVMDSFQNFIAGLGIGTGNLSSGGTYSYNFITRNRALLDALYRGNWIVQRAVNVVANDMTRAGIDIQWPGNDNNVKKINRFLRRRRVWKKLNEGIRWGRLYGGCIAVMLIKGQDPSTELRIDTIPRDSFKGLLVLDRWVVTPSNEIITEVGEKMGMPMFYTVASGSDPTNNQRKIHHSRVIRFEGIDLPYYQRRSELGWGMSIMEPVYDRMINFDTATAGAAQLVHKAHLRIYKIEGYRQAIADQDPEVRAGIAANINAIRTLQTIEGLSVIDKEDEMEFKSYSFSGLSDIIDRFAGQLAGAFGIPMTRLMGQSPGGLDSSGDSDVKTYYDTIDEARESDLRDPVHTVLQVTSMSECGVAFPDEADFTYNPLWQVSDVEKADISLKKTTVITSAFGEQLVSAQIALREMKAMSKVTGMWATITEDDIEEAESEVPSPEDLANAADPTGTKSIAGRVKDPSKFSPMHGR